MINTLNFLSLYLSFGVVSILGEKQGLVSFRRLKVLFANNKENIDWIWDLAFVDSVVTVLIVHIYILERLWCVIWNFERICKYLVQSLPFWLKATFVLYLSYIKHFLLSVWENKFFSLMNDFFFRLNEI